MADYTNISDAADDVPPREANKALVGNALNTAYEARAVVELDLSGASGQMPLVYDASTVKAIVQAGVPVLLSGSATGTGKMLVANGSYYADESLKVVLLGSGVPGSGVGWDGAYYVDTATGYEYGPKSAGSWPSTPRRGIQLETGSDAALRYKLEQPLDLGGLASGNDNIWAGTGTGGDPIKFCQITNGAQYFDDGYIAFDFQIAREATGYCVIKPLTPISDADLRIDGKGTGVLKDGDGSPYLTEATRAAMPYLWAQTTITGLAIATTPGSLLEPNLASASERKLGTWTYSAYSAGVSGGYAAPEDGFYIMETSFLWKNNGGAAATLTLQAIKDGTAITDCKTVQYTVAGGATNAILNTGPIELNAGEDFGILVVASGASQAVFEGWGCLSIRRVA